MNKELTKEQAIRFAQLFSNNTAGEPYAYPMLVGLDTYNVVVFGEDGTTLVLDGSTTAIEAFIIQAEHCVYVDKVKSGIKRAKTLHTIKRRTLEERSQLLAAYAKTKLDHATFCSKHNVGKSTLSRWVKEAKDNKLQLVAN